MGSLRTGTLKIVSSLSATNGAGTVPTSDTNGSAVPDGFRHEYAHLIAVKSNVADTDIYGLITFGTTTLTNNWVYLDSVSMTRAVTATKNNANEMAPFKGIAGVLRLCPVRTDANVSNAGCNYFFGFHESHGVD